MGKENLILAGILYFASQIHSTVYSNFQLAKKYFYYQLRAANGKGHGIHSPFIFDFILNVLNNTKNYQPPSEIEALRERLLKDKRILAIEDLGAGSRINIANKKTVSQLASTALKPKKYAALLFRLVKHYQPANIIELGTSLGLTTAYLAKANPQAHIITIEGSREAAAIAQRNFQQLNCGNIELYEGNFDMHLSSAISRLSSPPGLVYIDGNHRYEPTIRYFRECLSKSNENTILVFDDIHWSAEMERAWEAIKADPVVQYTIDIFFLGFVFFKKEFKVKQDFLIRF